VEADPGGERARQTGAQDSDAQADLRTRRPAENWQSATMSA